MKVSMEQLMKALKDESVAVEGNIGMGKCGKCGAKCEACSE